MTRVHPTKAKLIATFLDLAEQRSVESVTVEEVLNQSKISIGSLYHHFANFNDLIEEAMARLYAEGIDRSIIAMTSLLDCKTRDEFLSGIKRLIEQTLSPESKPFRLNRARFIGMCRNNDAMRARIGGEQERLSAAIEALIREFQSRGWIKRELNPATVSMFMQAYTFGKVIDDITLNPVDQEDWVNLMMQISEAVLLGRGHRA